MISILAVQRHLFDLGWQGRKTSRDSSGLQAGWCKAALTQKGPLYFGTILAEQVWIGDRLLLVFWKLNVLFKQCLSFKLVDAFPLEMHWFLYCERRFLLSLGFFCSQRMQKNALSSEAVKQCSGVEPWHHGEEKQIYAGEIFVFWLPRRGRHSDLLFRRHHFSCTYLQPFILTKAW